MANALSTAVRIGSQVMDFEEVTAENKITARAEMDEQGYWEINLTDPTGWTVLVVGDGFEKAVTKANKAIKARLLHIENGARR